MARTRTRIRYSEITELTPLVLQTFIERVEIHDRDKPSSKNATQKISIWYVDLGLIENVPDAQSEQTA